jgi:hypothetical protein
MSTWTYGAGPRSYDREAGELHGHIHHLDERLSETTQLVRDMDMHVRGLGERITRAETTLSRGVDDIKALCDTSGEMSRIIAELKMMIGLPKKKRLDLAKWVDLMRYLIGPIIILLAYILGVPFREALALLSL